MNCKLNYKGFIGSILDSISVNSKIDNRTAAGRLEKGKNEWLYCEK